jgi:hypothetical protein
MDDPAAAKQLDIGGLANRPGWKAEIKTVEDPLELQHRLQQDALEGKWHRWKDGATFAAVLVGLGCIVWLCFGITRDPSSTPEDRKWAMAVLASIVTGGMGFLVGKNSR